jgi:DNA polymerase-3 subunit epsilon
MRQRLIGGIGRLLAGLRSPPHALPMRPSLPDDEPLTSLPIVMLDTETTGLNVRRDRIVSLGALQMRGGVPEAASPLDYLVHPGIVIPPRASAIHGLTDAAVALAPPFALVAPALLAFWHRRVLIGHNIAFDLAILRHEAERARLPFRAPAAALDIGLLYAGLRPRQSSITLEAIAADFAVDIEGRHTALGDARLAAGIWTRMLPGLGHAGIATLGAARAMMTRQRDLLHGQNRAGWATDLLVAGERPHHG